MMDLSRFLPPWSDLLPSRGRRRRRTWVGRGKAHLEVRTSSRPGSEDLAAGLTQALERIDGVDWAEVNGIVGRVVVAFDDDRVDLDDLLTAVEEAEAAAGVHDERFSHDRAEHPGDGESLLSAGLGVAIDLVGLGVSVATSALRAMPVPTEVGAVVSFAENQPRVRGAVQDALGPIGADIALTVVTATSQALTQGPVALVVDAGHRLNLLAAARARQLVWERREAELFPSPEAVARAPVEIPGRPAPLPDGPLETYLERAGIAGIAAGGVTALSTRSLRRAAGIVLATSGKPSRLGREAYTSWVELALARRDVLVLDQQALRRLDRVDCLVLPHDLLQTGQVRIERTLAVGDASRSRAHEQLRALFDPHDPSRVVRAGRWAVGPWPSVGGRTTPDLAEALAALGDGVAYAVTRNDEVRLVFDVASELDASAAAIVEAAHDEGLLVAIANDDPSLLTRLRADILVQGGPALHESVAALQGEGRVVAVVANDHHVALRAADVGVGLHRETSPAWGADVIIPTFDHLWFLIEACGVAHEVDRQSNAIALAGASVGSMFALTAPERAAARRAANAANVASTTAMANGVRAAVLLERRTVPSFERVPSWHELPRTEVLELLQTSATGLSDPEASTRQPPRARTWPVPLRLAGAVATEMANPLTPVLAGSALLSAAVGSVADAGIVFSVMGLNGLVSGIQRFVTEESVRGLLRAGAVAAHVRRDGELVELQAEDLVPGDVVVLESGDTVPADCRVLGATSLQVDESSLTGESEPVTKTPAPTFAVLVAERSSMLYAGTAVVAGSATAGVVAVGTETEAGFGNGAGSRTANVGVEARLRELSTISLPVAGASGVVVTAGQLLRGSPLQTSLANGVSLAVAAVPEGLPMLATVAQLAAARRLSSRNVLVRNPRALEALGRVDVLCIDKTGTLTEGHIAVTSVTDGRSGRGLDELRARDRRLLRAAAVASPHRENGRSFAHATDRVIREAADRAVGDDDDTLARGELVHELPFGPTRHFHARWERDAAGTVLAVKGAPEIVLDRCTGWRRGQRHRRLTGTDRADIERHLHELAQRGLRVLAVARRSYGPDGGPPRRPGDDDVRDLDLLGFVALSDPVRSSASDAVTGLRAAGVSTVMITGDHPVTAEGIAAELGILDDQRVLTGADLQTMTDAELDSALGAVSVFARVSPTDKVRIVAAYQRLGRSVAMTGDGANDARAIRRADVGIAVGEHSTPTARTAADVIITDDRLETIVAAIVEGRALWSSVRDALAILLGGNLGEIGFILLSGGLSGQPSLSTRQVLLVNLFTDVLPSLAIASRPPPGRSADELAAAGPDRSLGEQLDRAIVQRAVATTAGATLAWGLGRMTGRPRRASTIGLGAVVGTQLGQTITAGHFDPLVAASALGSAAALAGIIQTPGVSQFFGCTPLGPVGWTIVIGSSAAATAAANTIPDQLEWVVNRLASLRAHPPVDLPARDGQGSTPDAQEPRTTPGT